VVKQTYAVALVLPISSTVSAVV